MEQGIIKERIFLIALLEQLNMYTSGRINATRCAFGKFLCDRVQGVERLFTHPYHCFSQVPPSPVCSHFMTNRCHNSSKDSYEMSLLTCLSLLFHNNYNGEKGNDSN